jgi:prepilin-type N-terminal cleavage/methylation domain-containing protein/prepilin-type processing-associated H-X9-DG protein
MRYRKAFTLIELLVVIAIIALLLSIIVPALKAAKEAARRVVCQSNLKSVSLANSTYADGNENRYVSWEMDPGIYDNVGRYAPWCTNPTFIRILDQTNDENQLTNINPADVYQFPKRFRCPSAVKTWEFADIYEDSYIATTIAGNYTSLNPDDISTTYVNPTTIESPYRKIMFLDSADMCMFVEKADFVRYWDKYGEVYNNQISYGYLAPAYRHNEGANGCYADGHVEYRPKERLFYYIDDVEQANNGDWGRNKHMWSFTGDDPLELW